MKEFEILLWYNRFSLAPSFLQQFLTLLSLSCNSFSLRTISRTSALVQLSAVVSGDCVENEEEKEGDCVRIRQVFSRSFILATISHSSFSLSLSLAIVSPSALFREPPHLFSCRRWFLVTTSEMKKKKNVIVVSWPTGFGKSCLALELTKPLNGEIVSADSVQVIYIIS